MSMNEFFAAFATLAVLLLLVLGPTGTGSRGEVVSSPAGAARR